MVHFKAVRVVSLAEELVVSGNLQLILCKYLQSEHFLYCIVHFVVGGLKTKYY